MPEIATVWVSLVATTKNMEADAKRAIDRIEKSAKITPTVDGSKLTAQTEKAAVQAGERAGKGFGSQFASAGARAMDQLKGMGGSGGSAAGSNFAEGFADKVKGLGSKAGPIGLAITAAAGVALVGGKLVADQLAAGMEQQQSRANVAAKLGVDPATMKKIAGAASAAYGQNFGESVDANLDTARAAIQSGLIGPNADSGATQVLIAQLSTVSGVLGEEIPATAKAAQQAIRTGLAPDATSAFDLIVKAQQAGVNTSEDFLDTLNEYGTQFRKLGLSGPEAVGLIAQAMRGGARDSDVAADALKEFSIRAVDGSKTTTDAYATLGLSADDMAQKIAQGGPAARTAFGTILNSVRSIKDPVEQSQIAVSLFGTQAEDLGAAFQNFDLSTAVDQLGQVQGAAQRASDTVGATTQSAWDTLTRTLQTTLGGAQVSLAETLGPALTQGLSGFVTWLGEHKADVGAFFKTLADAALEAGTIILSTFGSIAGTSSDLARAFGANGVADSLNFAAEAAQQGLNAIDRGHEIMDRYAERAQAAANVTRDLGDNMTLLPDEKTLVLKDNSPEAIARINQAKYTFEQIPGTKDFRVVPKTEEAAREVAAFIAAQTGKEIQLYGNVDLTKASEQVALFAQQLKAAAAPPTMVLPPGMSRPGQPSPFGGVPIPRSGGAIVPMADGGLTRIIKPANADIYAGRGAGTIFAEQETGGEAYIPLAPAKRPRSKRILQEVMRRFGMMADGGITVDSLKALASQASGGTYVRGGPPGPTMTDCSGLQAWISNLITGGSGRFSTRDEATALLSRGFQQGDPPPGVAAYWIGWKNGGDGGGHTAGTILDPNGGSVNVEMGGANGGGAFGGGAQGASGFPNRAWIQIAGGEDPNAASNFSSGAGSTAAVQSASAGVTSAKSSVTSAQASLDQANAAVDEAKTKGQSADKVATAEKKRDAAQQRLDAATQRQTAAETKLADVKEKAADGSGKSGGMDGSSLGQTFLSGIMETLGVPNFMNLMDTPNYKSGAALLNYGLGFLGGGQDAAGGDPTAGAAGGIGLPNLSNLLQPQGPQAMSPVDPNTMQHGQANGAAPGPDPAPVYQINGNVGWDPRAITDRFTAANNANYRRNMAAVRP